VVGASFAARSHLEVYSPWVFLDRTAHVSLPSLAPPSVMKTFFLCDASVSPDVFFALSASSRVIGHASPHPTVYNLYPAPGVTYTIHLGPYILHFTNEFVCRSFPLGT
jgi:hypothetical protein